MYKDKIVSKEEEQKNELLAKIRISQLQSEISEKLESYIEECYRCRMLSDKAIGLIYDYQNGKNITFYEAFLSCINSMENEIFSDTDKIIISGLKVVLKDVFETANVSLEDINCENYQEIFDKLHKNKDIIDKYLSIE